MTDKVQKIRKEVERLKSNLIYGACSSQIAMETMCKEEAYNEILAILDSLQEEPVSDDFEKIVEEIAEPTILNAYGTKELARRLRNTICYISVSEELEEASKEWLRPQLDKSYANYGEAKMMELTHFDGYAMLDAIEFGAKWQKTKVESTTEDLGEYISELSKQFPEVSFAKLSRIAVRAAKWQKQKDEKAINENALLYNARLEGIEMGKAEIKQQMMVKAVETTFNVSLPSCLYDKLWIKGCKDGDKLLVIKKDEL